jgi:hypothetical protein
MADLELLVTEITVTIGVTRNLGDYESLRFDLSSKATLSEPVTVDSREYRQAHRELVTAVEAMVHKTEAQLLPDEPDAKPAKGKRS